ncbi:unnamed protein product [Arabidopsis thaliana]|uniref:Uncharacterized protein n=1 Tax=Arabidopsis thaliana TaxID=3702 RepID=A0A5S9XR14_ARATH|nr:unnamed protein product [Arabidopsis thaliana]
MCSGIAREVPVFLIAGSWEFSDKDIWDFYIAKECYARSISMTSDMSYEELLLRVRTEFELHGLELKPKLSYWLPCQLSVFFSEFKASCYDH